MLYPNKTKPIRTAKDANVKMLLCNINFNISPKNPRINISAPKAINIKDTCLMFILTSNQYNIKNKELIHYNRQQLFETKRKDWKLEQRIKNEQIPLDFKSSIQLPDDDLNNWDDPI